MQRFHSWAPWISRFLFSSHQTNGLKTGPCSLKVPVRNIEAFIPLRSHWYSPHSLLWSTRILIVSFVPYQSLFPLSCFVPLAWALGLVQQVLCGRQQCGVLGTLNRRFMATTACGRTVSKFLLLLAKGLLRGVYFYGLYCAAIERAKHALNGVTAVLVIAVSCRSFVF